MCFGEEVGFEFWFMLCVMEREEYVLFMSFVLFVLLDSEFNFFIGIWENWEVELWLLLFVNCFFFYDFVSRNIMVVVIKR